MRQYITSILLLKSHFGELMKIILVAHYFLQEKYFVILYTSNNCMSLLCKLCDVKCK